MFNAVKTYPVGIDFDDRYVYAVRLKKTRQGLTVKSMAKRPLESDLSELLENPAPLVAQLQEMKKEAAFGTSRTVVRLPAQYVSCFPIRFRVAGSESIEEAMLQESEKHLPFPVAEAVIDYPSLVTAHSEEYKHCKAIIVATRTEHINQLQGALKVAGLTLDAVEADLSPLLRLHRHFRQLSSHPVMLCYLGHTEIHLSIVTPKRFLVHRTIPWGTQVLLSRVQKELELSETQAVAILRERGLPATDAPQEKDLEASDSDVEERLSRALFQISVPFLEALIYEFHSVLGYVISEEPDTSVKEMVVYGQGGLIPSLDQYLEKALNLPTTLLDPLKEMPRFAEEPRLSSQEGAPFGLALGLAMRGVSWL